MVAAPISFYPWKLFTGAVHGQGAPELGPCHGTRSLVTLWGHAAPWGETPRPWLPCQGVSGGRALCGLKNRHLLNELPLQVQEEIQV